MTDDQTRHLNAAEVGLEYLDDNQAAWGGSAAFQAQRDGLETHIETIEELAEAQEADISGNTTAKNAAKQAMALKAVTIAKPLTVYAKVSGKDELKAEVDYELTDLVRAKDADSQSRCQLIHDRATTHLEALLAGQYPGIDATSLANLQQLIDAFDTAQPAHGAAESHRQTITAALAKEFEDMALTVENIKELSDAYRQSNAAFASGVKNAFELDDSGKRKLSLEVRYTDEATGVFLRGVQATLVEKDLVKKSSRVGRVPFFSLGSGNFTLQSALDGYAAGLLQNIAVKEGEITRLAVALTKV